MASTNNRWWAKVEFKDFIRHFRKLNDEQIIEDVRKSMDDLENFEKDSDSFGSMMIRLSLEFDNWPSTVARRENGKKGGRPRKSTADGDTREDSLNVTDGSNAALLESGTSANIYGEGSAENVRERTSAKELPSPIVKTDPKPVKTEKVEVKPPSAKHPHGEFENIMLTTEEYIKLCERLENADELINEADQYFEAQPDKAKKYKSHYAMLLSWDRRRKDAERPKQGFMTSDDISRRNAEESHRRLAAMFGRSA